MPVKTTSVPRRHLFFKCLGCLRGELDRIEAAHRAGTLTTTGNWTPGENLDHCAIPLEEGLDGTSKKGSFMARLFGRMVKSIILKPKRDAMRPGFNVGKSNPQLMPRPGVTYEQGMARIRRALARIEAGERMTKPSPWLGAMTHEEWVRLNLNHTAMHFGFLTYPGAPQE
jgi:hypothetical protein